MRTVVVTGAGISHAAGLPLYRDGEDDWADPKFERMSHASRCGNHLDKLWPHWSGLAELAEQAHPTDAHLAIAEMGWPVVTQNIDGLHQRAGSPALEVHGSIHTARCIRCRSKWSPLARLCPACGSMRTRPDLVLFGEQTRHTRAAKSLIRGSHVIYVGTSGTVHPVAWWYEVAATSTLVGPARWGNFDNWFEGTADEWALTL